MTLRQDIEDFLTYCEVIKQYSANTVRNYRRTLERMADFFEKIKIISIEHSSWDHLQKTLAKLDKSLTIPNFLTATKLVFTKK